MTTERPQAPPPLVVRWDFEKTVAQLGRRAKLAIILGLLAAAAVIAVAVLRVVRPITDALDSVRQQSEEVRESMRAITPAELSRIDPQSWRPLAVPPPPDGLASFDPVGRLEWVLGIARAWARDAVLESVEGGPIARDGTLNLAGEADAVLSYDFLSPRRLAEWDREADLKREATADYRLEIAIAGGRVTARVVRGRPLRIKAPPADRLLAVGELLTRARAHGFPDRPFYAGSLRYLAPHGWQWQLQTPSGRDTFPRVRAVDGGVRR